MIGAGVVTAEPRERWFAVWTRNQWEPRVETALRRKRFEVFLPALRVPSRRRDRRAILARPLFPGYLFVRFEPGRDTCLRAAGTEGVVRLLGERWDRLDPIPDGQVHAIRRIVADESAHRVPWIQQGAPVRIIAGPFAGLEGFVQDARPGRATFVVSVDLLRRSVGVEVPDHVLAPL